MNILVREANVNDCFAINALWNALLKDQLGKDHYYKGSLEECDNTDNIKRDINNSNHKIFLAECDHDVVGFIEMCIMAKDYYYFISDYAYIIQSYVKPAYRAEIQIMFQFYKKCEQWALSKNAQHLQVDVFEHNKPVAMALQGIGFNPYRTRYIKELD